jgi:hypothetical protein
MPRGEEVGASSGTGEMPAGVVGGEIDPASGAIDVTGGEMPDERGAAVAASESIVEINTGRWRVTISPS